MAEQRFDRPVAPQLPPTIEPPASPVPDHIAAAYERRKTLGVFSTNNGLHPPRDKLDDQPMQIRTDELSAKLAMMTRLRKKFPEECMALPPVGTFPVGILYEYWDAFDIQFYGSHWLWELLELMSYQNKLDKAARAKDVMVFVNDWIQLNRQAFHMITGDYRWLDLFTQETIEGYGCPFLWDAFWKIAEIRERHGTSPSHALGMKLTYIAQDNGERLRLATQPQSAHSLQPAHDPTTQRQCLISNQSDMVGNHMVMQDPLTAVHGPMAPPTMLHTHPMQDYIYFDPICKSP